jgi:hypothetical protein
MKILINELPYTEFHGYSLFTDVINPTIRAWNRANTVYNIKERHGDIVATKYVEKFPQMEQAAIYSTMITVAKDGYENVRRSIFREANAQDALNA